MAKKPARKPAQKKPAAKTAAAKPSEVMPIINEKDFRALLRAVKGHEADKNESVGGIGSAISAAVEKKHLDKKAFAIFRSLDRMSDRKLATTRAHLDHYCEIGGIDDRISKQGDLIGREQELAEVSAETITPGKGKKKNGEAKAQPEPETTVTQFNAPADSTGVSEREPTTVTH